jgi:hypothetical protein
MALLSLTQEMLDSPWAHTTRREIEHIPANHATRQDLACSRPQCVARIIVLYLGTVTTDEPGPSPIPMHAAA